LRSQCKVILLSLKFFVNKTFDATVATVTSLDAFMNELHPKAVCTRTAYICACIMYATNTIVITTSNAEIFAD